MPPIPPPLNSQFGADDSAQMLKLLELEILNRRAKRLAQGGDQRAIVRMVGVLLLFVLVLVVMGAMWYMQTSQMEGRLPRHAPQLTAAPAPAASVPAAAPSQPRRPTDR